MATKNKAVFGIYVSQLDAENAVHGLKLAGFRSTDISILFPDNAGTKDLAMERNTKAPEGTAAGAGSGAQNLSKMLEDLGFAVTTSPIAA